MLELKNLCCQRGNRLLFATLNARLSAGQSLWLRGANGMGKTSLLRMVCGLSTPEAGHVLWHGQSIQNQRNAFHQSLLYLGHQPALKDDLSALENLCHSAGALAPQATAALRQLGLGGREHLAVKHLSQGQKRRIALARLALARTDAQPLWVLDEPFVALDDAALHWLAQRMATHVNAGGLLIYTSHQAMALPDLLPEQQLQLNLADFVPKRGAGSAALGLSKSEASATPFEQPRQSEPVLASRLDSANAARQKGSV